MIAKISRGRDVGGLLRYLMGPGRFNEHTNQHVMASWDAHPASHQPETTDVGGFGVSDLAQDLNAPAVAAGVSMSATGRDGRSKSVRGPVWHCSLRNHASDRVLSDAEWERVIVDLLDRTGIAPRGDAGSCRWVAVRHGEDHVHIAAMLVRQDNGRRVHPRNDYKMARETCRDAERRLGLVSTAPADRTAAEPSTRAEMEKAARRGEVETSRQWLRRAARIAAVQAQEAEEFFGRLGDLGVLVRPRSGPDGGLVGYSVAAPGDANATGGPVWFAGGKLANDLTLAKLQARWRSAPPPPAPVAPSVGELATVGRQEREEAVAEATSAIEHATAALAAGADEDAADVAHAAGDMFVAVGAAGGRSSWVALQTAAELYDRASRSAGVGQPGRWGPVAAQLRTAAWRLIAVRSFGTNPSRDSGVVQLVVACAALAAEIAAGHEQKALQAQAAAAGRTARAFRESTHAGARTASGGRGVVRRDSRGPGRDGPAPVRGARPEQASGPAVPGQDQEKRGRGNR